LIAKILEDDLTPMFKLGLAAKDMRLVKDLAEGVEARFDCGQGALTWYELAEAEGRSDQDWGAVAVVE
jgi:3-hydroxyisobutyrate dehydrogenase-like beta-hydroxyacid dehydrogenase